jgi:hypothetical protein
MTQSKLCKKCGKANQEYRQTTNRSGKLYDRNTCIECENAAAKIRVLNKYRTDQEYRARCLDRMKSQPPNPEYRRMWQKRKEALDPSFKIRRRVSTAIRKHLTNKNNTSIFKYLPYSAEELKRHLESMFEPWMNWDNYGSSPGCWSIDHVKPQSKLPYTSYDDPNFHECWALENLQPMRHIDNMKKGNKWPLPKSNMTI